MSWMRSDCLEWPRQMRWSKWDEEIQLRRRTRLHHVVALRFSFACQTLSLIKPAPLAVGGLFLGFHQNFNTKPEPTPIFWSFYIPSQVNILDAVLRGKNVLFMVACQQDRMTGFCEGTTAGKRNQGIGCPAYEAGQVQHSSKKGME